MTMRRFILAVQFLTRLPTPQVADFQPADLSRSAVFFPAVGVIIGACVAAAVWIFALINPWLAAFFGTLMWVWITGGLHLDGLADVADALGAAHRSPERFEEVLRDPHTGSFAVIVVCLQIAAKLVLLASLPSHVSLPSLVLIPALARWGTLLWSLTVPPLKQGLAERFGWDIGWVQIAAWGLGLAVACIAANPYLLAAFVIVPLVSVYWRWRLGGISGDCLGASLEVTESLLLLALVIGAAISGSLKT
jgi:adenosylcobinamide-GDP ribazoletransferase